MSNVIKILAIDGGGIRGIIPAIILAEIEHRSGQAIVNLFDLIAGSSTGGLLAMGLVSPDQQSNPLYTAEELVRFYEHQGPLIFSRSMWRAVAAVNNLTGVKYTSDGIDGVLDHCFGDLNLADALGDVFVTSYEIQRRQPWFFRSHQAHKLKKYNFKIRDVVRSTTAAPTYFEPSQVFHDDAVEGYFAFIDGGMVANNPALAAYAEAKKQYPHANEFLLVSLGTGDHTRPIDFEEARQWGLAGWSQHIMDVAFDATDTTVDYQLRRLLPACKDGIQHYYRFQIRLVGASDDIDNVSHKNIESLKILATKLIEENDALIDQIVEYLLL
jgi:patatin-like phospholipase/acyl hydrolase